MLFQPTSKTPFSPYVQVSMPLVTVWFILLTSKVIHEIGSSCGISDLLMSFNDSVSSSNSKEKMAPGGVQVPTIR